MANIIEINDISAPELEVFTKLTEKQLRHKLEPEKGIFIAESGKVIELALAAGCEPISLLMERRHITGQAQNILARYEDVTVYTGDRDVLAGLTGYKLTRGILCAMRRPRLPSLQQICFQARRVAVLDNITDAANIGGIFRSAAALGVDAVLVMRSCCDPLCRKAVRVSMGTVFQIPWTYIENNVKELGEWGFKTAAMALCEHAVSIDDQALMAEGRLALVFGTEGYGLSQAAIDACDYVVKIPMEHNVDSLNVAAASALAIAMSTINRKKDSLELFEYLIYANLLNGQS